jgi:hypothetical protein
MMSGNLIEFIKVFSIVFTFSGGILAFRWFMLSFDESDERAIKKSATSQKQKPEAMRIMERKVLTDSDFIDYDGMGNQGRFPTRENNRV